MRCPFCDQALTDDVPERYFGLELCRACCAGQTPLPLPDAAWRLEVSYTPGDDESNRLATIVADGHVDHAPRVRVTFWRRRWWTRAIEAVRGRVRTGDDVFDAQVWISTNHADAVRGLLASDAVRASLMDCVVHGELRVQPGNVTCLRMAPELSLGDVNETTRAVLVLMHRLRTITEG